MYRQVQRQLEFFNKNVLLILSTLSLGIQITSQTRVHKDALE